MKSFYLKHLITLFKRKLVHEGKNGRKKKNNKIEKVKAS